MTVRFRYYCDTAECGASADHLPDCIHCSRYFCRKHGADDVCGRCDAKIERLAGIQARIYRERPESGRNPQVAAQLY